MRLSCMSRGGAVACVRAMATKVQDAAALASMSAVAEALLNGTAPGGKLRNVQERAAVVASVGAMSAAPGRSQGKVELGHRVAMLLCKVYK